MLGTQDLVVGLIIVFFLFGAKRLPELAGSLGRSMKEFKKAVEGGHAEETDAKTTAAATTATREPSAPPQNERRCASCEARIEAEWRHCPKCGAELPAPRPS